MNLSWKRPLLYLLIPVFIVMVFLGFPPPLAPPRATRPSQEQAERNDKRDGKRKPARASAAGGHVEGPPPR